MPVTRLSETFRYNLIFLSLFAIWPTETASNYYKIYSAIYLFIALCIYNVLHTISLFFTPRDIELLIHEEIFYFTEIAVIAKVLMIYFKQKKIREAFDLLDSEPFKATSNVSKDIIETNVQTYRTCWKSYMILCYFTYSSVIIAPVFFFLIFNTELSLPICNYYFLSDKIRDTYFYYWYFFQAFGLFGSMNYNASIDTFTGGLILMAITQMRVLNHELRTVKLNALEVVETKDVQEKIALAKLIKCVKHYDDIIKYCTILQNLLGVTEFVQFGMASAIICSCMYCFTMHLPLERYIFTCTYCTSMICEIFVPAWLGSELDHQNFELGVAAYNSEWIPRSEKFKQNLKLFMVRANTPMILKGTQMFPLTLQTFVSIMRTAYSLFTLVRNVQDR